MKRVVGLTAVMAAGLTLSGPATACSSPGPVVLADSVKADVVALGTIRSRSVETVEGAGQAQPYNVSVLSMDVSQVLLGEATQSIVFEMRGDADRLIGKQYVVVLSYNWYSAFSSVETDVAETERLGLL